VVEGAAAVTSVLPQRRRLGAVLLMLAQSFQALAWGGIGLFLPLIREDIGLTFAEAGALSAAALVVYATMQLPSGYLADRFGPKRLFAFGMLGTNLLTFSFAMLHRYPLMVANQAASGFFRALVFAPGLLLMSALFPPSRRATAMGLYVAGGFSSSVLLNLLGPVLVGPLGWRALFMIFAGGGVAVLLAYLRAGPDGPRRSGEPIAIRQALRLFRSKVMWVIGAIQYCRLAIVTGLTFWLPSFLVDDRGRSLQLAGVAVGIAAALTAPSNFLGGYISDRLKNPLLVIGASLAAIAVITFFLAQTEEITVLIPLIALEGIFMQLYFGPLFVVPIEMLGARAAGSASGFGNFFANVGGFTFAYTLGALKDATGSFSIGFYCLAGLAVFGVACTVLLSRMRPLGEI
jgi:MFS transporter, ACS family, D-galactonate transporter